MISAVLTLLRLYRICLKKNNEHSLTRVISAMKCKVNEVWGKCDNLALYPRIKDRKWETMETLKHKDGSLK